MAYREYDLWAAPPSSDLQRFAHITSYAKYERMPWRRTASGADEELRAIERRDAGDVEQQSLDKTAFVPRRVFRRALSTRFEHEIADASRHALLRAAPEATAFRLFTDSQNAVCALMLLTSIGLLIAAPATVLIFLNVVFTVYFLVVIFFRAYLTIIAFTPGDAQTTFTPLPDAALPVVTILLPVYDEAEGLPILVRAIRSIDYPADKLDIKLLLEADDEHTIREANRLGLDRLFDCVIVPNSEPRTKPKACNHALYLARGDLIVIYDAEDAPEPDQLRKAAAAFAASDENLACVQARLNFYNARENLLTRLFTLEYSLWFDFLLPALERLQIPIPLGGTSNFFRTRALIEIGGWDPYNVTEDADLGLRLARCGYRTEILDSTTFEEANCSIPNWIRQRSRWMKGYMQTWLVHMRAPVEFYRVAGWRSIVATHLFVAGNFFSALINPVSSIVFAAWLLTRAEIFSVSLPGPLLTLNLFALLVGNALFIGFAIVAPIKRGWSDLAPYALLAPAYWWLTSIAAYKALWQLLTRPTFWEKTDHVLSAAAKQRRLDALDVRLPSA